MSKAVVDTRWVHTGSMAEGEKDVKDRPVADGYPFPSSSGPLLGCSEEMGIMETGHQDAFLQVDGFQR